MIHLQPALSGQRERAGVREAALLACLMLSACGTPTACLANRYTPGAAQAQCVTGVTLPGNALKDTDLMSGSTAPERPPS